jgi:hypothetical protein
LLDSPLLDKEHREHSGDATAGAARSWLLMLASSPFRPHLVDLSGRQSPLLLPKVPTRSWSSTILVKITATQHKSFGVAKIYTHQIEFRTATDNQTSN